MHIRIERYDEDGSPLTVGLRKSVDQGLTRLDFRTFATLRQIEPEAWSAEVLLFGKKIAETQTTYPSKYAAASEVDRIVEARLIALLLHDVDANHEDCGTDLDHRP